MTTLQVTDVVRPRIDRSAGRGWIRSAVHFREVRDRNRRNLVLDFLAGKNIRVVDPVAAALIQARFGEHVDVHLVERVTEGEFVEKVRPNRAGPAQRRRRVRSVPLRARQIEPRARTKCVDRLPREVRYAADDLIRGVCDVVDAHRVLPRIARVRAGANPVLVAALKSRGRQRIRVQQREAVRTQAIGRNDVARERLPGRRVLHCDSTSEPQVRRIEQLAEIAFAHFFRWHRIRVRRVGSIPNALLAPEEEHPVALPVESRQHDGAAERSAEVVDAQRRGRRQERIVRGVAAPAVRVELVVAHVVVDAAVKIVAAALGDESDLPARRSTVLGQKVGRQHLHFLDGVDVERADHRAGRPRARGDRAVDRDEVLVVAASVDVEVAGREAVAEVRVSRIAGTDTGLEHREADRIAAVQRKILDVLQLDRLAVLRVELQRRRFRDDRHHLADGRWIDCRVERQPGGRVEPHVLLRPFLEPGQLDFDVVATRRQRGDDVVSGRIGDDGSRQPRLDVGGRDARAGNDAAGLVLDDAGDLPAVELGEGWTCDGYQCGRKQRGTQSDRHSTLHPPPPAKQNDQEAGGC